MRYFFNPDTFCNSINGVVEKNNIRHFVQVETLLHPLFADNAWRIDQRHLMAGCGDQLIQKMHVHIAETVGRCVENADVNWFLSFAYMPVLLLRVFVSEGKRIEVNYDMLIGERGLRGGYAGQAEDDGNPR